MRAREFITERNQEKLDEFLPLIGALARGVGGTLARGAGTALGAAGGLAGGAAQGIGSAVGGVVKGIGNAIGGISQGIKSATGTSGSTGSSAASTTPAKKADPVNVPTGVTIEPAPVSPGDNPNELKFNMGGATFSLDTKDPKNAQAVQQLKQQMAGNK